MLRRLSQPELTQDQAKNPIERMVPFQRFKDPGLARAEPVEFLDQAWVLVDLDPLAKDVDRLAPLACKNKHSTKVEVVQGCGRLLGKRLSAEGNRLGELPTHRSIAKRQTGIYDRTFFNAGSPLKTDQRQMVMAMVQGGKPFGNEFLDFRTAHVYTSTPVISRNIQESSQIVPLLRLTRSAKATGKKVAGTQQKVSEKAFPLTVF